eukprot:TRINITY_DN15462_c0_g1_i1.p1 TRINITY_DN15462_c0_g1~~TRINITY_DN15462_c0_g1_i1.p1  ORF type:complete len:392 (-),score=74.96 TRINITY_DN15462_c0_g1_i1:59-1135(-)
MALPASLEARPDQGLELENGEDKDGFIELSALAGPQGHYSAAEAVEAAEQAQRTAAALSSWFSAAHTPGVPGLNDISDLAAAEKSWQQRSPFSASPSTSAGTASHSNSFDSVVGAAQWLPASPGYRTPLPPRWDSSPGMMNNLWGDCLLGECMSSPARADGFNLSPAGDGGGAWNAPPGLGGDPATPMAKVLAFQGWHSSGMEENDNSGLSPYGWQSEAESLQQPYQPGQVLAQASSIEQDAPPLPAYLQFGLEASMEPPLPMPDASKAFGAEQAMEEESGDEDQDATASPGHHRTSHAGSQGRRRLQVLPPLRAWGEEAPQEGKICVPAYCAPLAAGGHWELVQELNIVRTSSITAG